MTVPALVAERLEKRFGPVVALRGLDLRVERGESCLVLGPNGAGKSTLLRIAAGLARPSAGHLTIGGGAGRGATARARIGYVGHATGLYPDLTCRENLLFAARLHRIADGRGRAECLLVEQGLEAFAERPAGVLSRGLGQRLAIARALVHDPPLLLLDEPYTGLDRAAAERFTARLAGLRAQGRTLLIVTHEVASAGAIADRAVVLQAGRIVREASGGGLQAAWQDSGGAA